MPVGRNWHGSLVSLTQCLPQVATQVLARAAGISRLALEGIAPVAAGRSSGSFWLAARDVCSLPHGLLTAWPFASVQHVGCEPEREQMELIVSLQPHR